MAKKGQHHNDINDGAKSRGLNNPKQAMTITTGSYKKRETYEEQAREHRNPDPQPQAARHEWRQDTREPGTGTRARNPRSGRSGSDSNEDAGTRGH